MLELSALTRYEPIFRSMARIMVGFTYSLNGWQKFFGWFGGIDGHGQPADLGSLLGIAGVIETCGGALIILGLFTRPVAFLLSGQIAVAYFTAHAPQGPWPIMRGGNGGELAVFYCFFYLWLSSCGAGPWSVDRLLGRKT